MKKDKHIFLIILVILFFTIVVPVAINESYKHGVIYITKWDASDVLSYYGMLVSAAATMTTIICTITFTRKQIQRDRFLERNRERWKNVDVVITRALIDISPLKLRATGSMDTPQAMIHNRLSDIQSYMILAKTSLDMIKCYINPDEYEQIRDYIDEISKAIEQFCMIAHELETEYMVMQDLAISNEGHIPNTEFSHHLDRCYEIIKKIPPAYDGSYQKLLDMKREIFDKIYADIEQQAEEILQFKKRKKNSHAHT